MARLWSFAAALPLALTARLGTHKPRGEVSALTKDDSGEESVQILWSAGPGEFSTSTIFEAFDGARGVGRYR